MSLANLVPIGVSPSAAHVDVLLELAYLTAAIDGRLDEEEVAAYKQIIGRLLGAPFVNDAEVNALLSRFGGNTREEDIHERVQKIAPTLPVDLRPIAYKLSVGLAVADLDASQGESDLHVVLAEALGFDQDKVDELTSEVYESLDNGEE